MDQEGFSGVDGRTSIFDYWSVDTLRRWNNNGEWNDKLYRKRKNYNHLSKADFTL